MDVFPQMLFYCEERGETTMGLEARLLGRTKIYTDETIIDEDNILSVLRKAYAKHLFNRRQMQFLIDYEGGQQPLKRQKIVRPDIDIKVNGSVANYVKEFKIGYNWSSPIMLVQRGDKEMHDSDSKTDDAGITSLTEILPNGENIGYKDQCMAEFIEICGIGHRMIDIKTDFDDMEDGEPESLVDVYTLDSRYAFCVYNNGTGQKKVLGVTYRKVSGKLYFTCFTKECRYEIQSGEIVSVEKNPLKDIPIIEYERSFDRTGCFERKIPEIDALNILMSDFTNDVSQRTQEIWWGNDIKFPVDEEGNEIQPKSGQWLVTYSNENGKPSVQPLSSTFDSGSTLSAISDYRSRIFQDCKVPIQYESSGSGSTGTATDMSSGWSAAELDAMREQQMTEKGKREEIKLILRAIQLVPSKILPEDSPIRKIHSSDIDFHFNRRKNYDMSVKANTFATYVSHGIHGRHALKVVDAFGDVEQVWNDSQEMIEKYQESLWKTSDSSSTSTIGDTGSNTSEKIQGDTSDQTGNSPILDGLNTDSNKIQA